MISGEYAYHSDPDTSYDIVNKYLQEKMICAMTEVHVVKTRSAIWAPHHSPFGELVKIGY